MTKISSVSSQNQLLMLKNAPEFTKIMIGEICTSLQLNVENFFLSNFTDDVWTKKKLRFIDALSSVVICVLPLVVTGVSVLTACPDMNCFQNWVWLGTGYKLNLLPYNRNGGKGPKIANTKKEQLRSEQ